MTDVITNEIISKIRSLPKAEAKKVIDVIKSLTHSWYFTRESMRSLCSYTRWTFYFKAIKLGTCFKYLEDLDSPFSRVCKQVSGQLFEKHFLVSFDFSKRTFEVNEVLSCKEKDGKKFPNNLGNLQTIHAFNEMVDMLDS